MGPALFSLPQLRGGSRKAQVREEGLEHVFCRVPSSKGNLYLGRPEPASSLLCSEMSLGPGGLQSSMQVTALHGGHWLSSLR